MSKKVKKVLFDLIKVIVGAILGYFGKRVDNSATRTVTKR